MTYGCRINMLTLGSAALALAVAGCQAAPGPRATTPVALSESAQAGRQLFIVKGCVACHRVPGLPEAQGTVGPNLAGIGNSSAHPKIAAVLDNTPENMKRWLHDPQKVKPGSAMPSLGMSETELTNLVAYLETLK